MARFNSEEQVMDVLGVKNLQNLSQDKTKEFVSLLPNMDREVAVGMVSQFPTFDTFARDVIEQLNGTCDRILSSNDVSQKDAIDGYKMTLNSLEKMIEDNKLSFENKRWVIEQMIEVSDRIAEKDTQNKLFLDRMHKRNVAMGIGMGILVLGGLALGVAGAAIYLDGRKKENELAAIEAGEDPDIDIDVPSVVSLDTPHVEYLENGARMINGEYWA